MIRVSVREETYRYNSYNLVRAFYPDSQVESVLDENQGELILVSDEGRLLAAVDAPGFSHDLPKASAAGVPAATEGKLVEGVPAATLGKSEAGASGRASGDKLVCERELYRQLKIQTGRELPWGILTGVRPTKLATSMLGFLDREAFKEWIYNERLVSPEKAELSWDIALREKKIIEDAGEGWSLYVHVPICPGRCSYCSFSLGLLKDWESSLDLYTDCLIREIGALGESEALGETKVPGRVGVPGGAKLPESTEVPGGAKLPGKMGAPTAVYIGGGTPTVLSGAQLSRLIEFIGRKFAGFREFTVEAGRPDTITEEKLRVMKDLGVTRISINPQTMQQKTLDLVGRRHSVAQVVESFRLARRLGFDNINMDLIAGLPGESAEDFCDTLEQIKALSPDSLTVHSLAIKRTAQMTSLTAPGSEVEKMIISGARTALELGMNPYYLYRQKSISGNFENVGYAREGREGIYNVLTMEEVQSIVGVGAGAQSKCLLAEPMDDPGRGPGHKTRILHSANTKDIKSYINQWR